MQALLGNRGVGLNGMSSPALDFKIPDLPPKIGKVVSGASMSTNDMSNNTGSPPTTMA